MTQQGQTGESAWLADPFGRFDQRYWDGAKWTNAVMQRGQVDSDPVPVDAPPDATEARPLAPELPVAPSAAEAEWIPTQQGERFTSLSPKEAQNRVAQMLPMYGIRVTNSVPGQIAAIASFEKKRSNLVAILLLLFWLLPGIIYWLMTSGVKEEAISVVFKPAGHGTNVALSGSGQARERMMPVLNQLPW